MRRVVFPELLDNDEGTEEEIRQSLDDLRFINRWFGGTHTTKSMIENVARLTGRREFSLLEVAAGSGDVPLGAARWLQGRGITVRVTLLDRAASHLNGAERNIVSDALALPFRDESFDLVSCGLFAHHLEPDEIVRFLGEGLRVCRVAVVVNDLRRSPLHLAAVYAGLPLFRSRLTRNDSVVSVKRAYTMAEMRSMMTQTRAERCDIVPSYLFRMGVIAWKRLPGADAQFRTRDESTSKTKAA